MARSIKRSLFFVPIFILCIVNLIGADVKLRIYLDDGSLQAGNFIQETNEKFVILAKSGRVEVPKNRIMFINGKTLKQWEERPDKYFQTEIIPSEIPDPGFVNDVTALNIAPPTVPAIKEKRAAVSPKKEEPVKAVPAKAVSKPAPAKSVEKKAVQKPVVKRSKPKVVKKKAKRGVKKAKKASVPVISKKVVAKPRQFNRQKFADYHYQKALNHLDQNEKGRTLQELHYATVLDRRNDEAAFLMGKLYVDAGVYPRARKTFKHPGLKKNQKVAQMLSQMVAHEKKAKKGQYVFFATVSAGLLTCVPVLILLRRFQPSVKKTIYEAEALQPAKAAPVPEANMPSEILDIVEKLKPEEEQKPASKEPAKEPDKPDKENLLAAFVAPPTKEELEGKGEGKPDQPVEKAAEKTTEVEPNKEEKQPEPVGDKKEPTVTVPPKEKKEPLPPLTVIKPDPEFKPVDPISEPPKPKEPPVEKPPIPVEKPRDPVTPPKETVRAPEPPPMVPVARIEPPQEEPKPVRQRTPLSKVKEDHEVVLGVLKTVDQLILKGNEFAAQDSLDWAIREYRTAMALDPASVEARLGLGYVCFSRRQWDLALMHYGEALEFDPKNADAHYGIGRVLLETEGPEEAIPELEKTLQIDPTFDDARDTLTALGKAA